MSEWVRFYEGKGLDWRYRFLNDPCNGVEVVIIGSNDFPDWISNVRRRMRTIGWTTKDVAIVSQGFFNEDLVEGMEPSTMKLACRVRVNRIDRKEALEVVRTLVSIVGDRAVWVRGHSRGAAIAANVVWELNKRGIECVGFGYGSKKTGNREFVESLEDRFLAFRNRGDWVPFVPLVGYAMYETKLTGSRWADPYHAHIKYDMKLEIERIKQEG